MRGPTLRGGHPTSMHPAISEPSWGALTDRPSEVNRSVRRCPPPYSKAGAAFIKLIHQLLLQVCSGFPSLTYPPNTLRVEARVQRVRVQTSPNAGRFWCGFVKGSISPIATSPCRPRRGGLARWGPRRRRPPAAPPASPPPDLLAAAGPPRRRRRHRCRPHHLAAAPRGEGNIRCGRRHRRRRPRDLLRWTRRSAP